MVAHMRRAYLLFVAHFTLWTVLVLTVAGGDRIGYDRLGDGTTPWVRQFIVALLVILTLQSVFITREKWWGEVLRDRPRSGKVWMWIPPILLLIAGFSRFASDGVSDAPVSYWLGMTVTMVLVGVTEELSFRGILVVGARREWGSERKALLLSSALFGLFHLPNWWFGQDLVVTLRQVVFTAVLGMAFYALRRVSGTLVLCMILHVAYDWMLIQGSFA